jgi:glyoxylase-like metal-dependent hydrolase (beta-lactamase superfamily II)
VIKTISLPLPFHPLLNSLTDDFAAANSSLQKLDSMHIETVYPGHGRPFSMHQVTIGSR